MAFAILIAAVVFAWNEHRKRSDELESARIGLEGREAELELKSTIAQIIASLDLKDELHCRAVRALAKLFDDRYVELFVHLNLDFLEIRNAHIWPAIAPGDEQESLRLVAFQTGRLMHPGHEISIIALMSEKGVIDVLIRRAHSHFESHSIELVDVNSDGVLDVRFDCRTLRRASGAYHLEYAASLDGFMAITFESIDGVETSHHPSN